MRAIEFESVIDGDIIRIPQQYIGELRNAVRVILLSADGAHVEPKKLSAEDFTELRIPTKGWKFDREEANERR